MTARTGGITGLAGMQQSGGRNSTEAKSPYLTVNEQFSVRVAGKSREKQRKRTSLLPRERTMFATGEFPKVSWDASSIGGRACTKCIFKCNLINNLSYPDREGGGGRRAPPRLAVPLTKDA
jgi:hypothetical protein